MKLKEKHISYSWEDDTEIDSYVIDFFTMTQQSLTLQIWDNRAATMNKPEYQWQFEYQHNDEERIVVKIKFEEDSEWRMEFAEDEIESIIATEDILQISLFDGQTSVFNAERWQWEISYIADSYLEEEE